MTSKEFHQRFAQLMSEAGEEPMTYREWMEMIGTITYALICFAQGLGEKIKEENEAKERGEQELSE